MLAHIHKSVLLLIYKVLYNLSQKVYFQNITILLYCCPSDALNPIIKVIEGLPCKALHCEGGGRVGVGREGTDCGILDSVTSQWWSEREEGRVRQTSGTRDNEEDIPLRLTVTSRQH